MIATRHSFVARGCAAVVTAAIVLVAADAFAQRGGRGGAAATPQAAAVMDMTGYWVSVITEDWKFRMVTPRKGIFETLTLNNEGRKVGEAWDPSKDEAAGEQCRAYGAANIMRMPGRLRVSWQDASTLKIEADAGTQTRLFNFAAVASAPAEPSWQGYSRAEWQPGPGGGRGAARRGSLKVVTTNLKPGYVRKNGAPYGTRAVVTEYYDINTAPNGDQWLTVTTRVEDPQYFSRPYLTSSDFKKLPTGNGWNPGPCLAR
jgi:hypothetical protein